MSSALELTRIEENEDEDEINNDRFIDQLPQPTHSSPAPSTSYDRYHDDCVTSKSHKNNDSKTKTSLVTDEQREPQLSPSSAQSTIETTSDEEGAVETTPVTSSPWTIGKQRISKSLDIKEQQMQKALGTFKRFHSQDNAKGRELIQSPESRSQDLVKINKKGRGRPRKEQAKTKHQPDAEESNVTAKPFTRSRDRETEPRNKNSQLNSNAQKTNEDDLSVQTQCPSGSKLVIKRIAKS